MLYHPDSKIRCSHCGEGALTLHYWEAYFELNERIGPDHLLRFTSGFRCWEWNRLCGSTDKSYHPLGRAGDLTCDTLAVEDLYAAAQDVERFKGLGIYPNENFIHTDDRDESARFGYFTTWNEEGEKTRTKMSWEELDRYIIEWP